MRIETTLSANTAHMAGISKKTLAFLRSRERAIIELANRAAEAAGKRLSDYKRPKAMCYSSPSRSLWSVQYEKPKLKSPPLNPTQKEEIAFIAFRLR